MQRILLLEDDTTLRGIIYQALSPDYFVSCCSSLVEAYALLDSKTYDVVLLDRILPDGDALEVIEYLADTSFSTKIIAISRLFALPEKIKGLELGADEYLPKPFSLAELKLKVKKLLQYEKKPVLDYVTIGSAVFEPASGTLTINQSSVNMRKKEAQILTCLCRYKNQVVSRQQLVAEVWKNQDSEPTETTLDVYIRRIRMVLQENGSLITTKRGFGYILETI